MLEGNPFPVSSCRGEIQVAEVGAGRSEVHWTISYETDADRAAVERDLSGLLRASAGALRAAAES